ncbi:MAG: AbrB family transcriptional regulator [Variovorax sp.]
MSHLPVVRLAATLLLALVAALACVWLHTPLPWMIGPLLATALASILGAPTVSATPLRNVGQATVGLALGLYFTPQVTALIAGVWWAIALAIGWALLLGWGFGRWLQQLHKTQLSHISEPVLRATTYFASSIGGASEMTLLAERAGARTDLVAAAHSVRLLIVTVAIPFAMQYSGLQALDLAPPAPREVHWSGLVLLGLLALGAALAVRATGRPNPWFLGPLFVGIGLTTSGLDLSAVPTWATQAAQMVIAVSLGVRFSREFVHTAPRWLASVAAATVLMLGLCAGFGWAIAMASGLPAATLILGTAPGGIAEMSITAKVLQLGVPVVTAFQVCRLVAVLVIVGPMYRWLYPTPKKKAV